MKHINKEITALCITIALILAIIISIPWTVGKPDKTPDSITAIIGIGENDHRSRNLKSGYSYHLLNQFAKDCGADISISIIRKGEDWADSLREGSTDLFVCPFDYKYIKPGLTACGTIDSALVWVTSRRNEKMAGFANAWISNYLDSESHCETRDMFLTGFDPIRSASAGRKRKYLGPYDGIIKEHASQLGWDWRFLAALIYQESQFKIHARSHRGATGLMQIMPSYTDVPPELLIDPEINIDTGTEMLRKLYRRYSNAANPDERKKFTLAAYNAGGGRVHQILTYADSLGYDTGTWDSAKEAINHMKFSGKETMQYVDNIFLIYDAFREVCP